MSKYNSMYSDNLSHGVGQVRCDQYSNGNHLLREEINPFVEDSVWTYLKRETANEIQRTSSHWEEVRFASDDCLLHADFTNPSCSSALHSRPKSTLPTIVYNHTSQLQAITPKDRRARRAAELHLQKLQEAQVLERQYLNTKYALLEIIESGTDSRPGDVSTTVDKPSLDEDWIGNTEGIGAGYNLERRTKEQQVNVPRGQDCRTPTGKPRSTFSERPKPRVPRNLQGLASTPRLPRDPEPTPTNPLGLPHSSQYHPSEHMRTPQTVQRLPLTHQSEQHQTRSWERSRPSRTPECSPLESPSLEGHLRSPPESPSFERHLRPPPGSLSAARHLRSPQGSLLRLKSHKRSLMKSLRPQLSSKRILQRSLLNPLRSPQPSPSATVTLAHPTRPPQRLPLSQSQLQENTTNANEDEACSRVDACAIARGTDAGPNAPGATSDADACAIAGGVAVQVPVGADPCAFTGSRDASPVFAAADARVIAEGSDAGPNVFCVNKLMIAHDELSRV